MADTENTHMELGRAICADAHDGYYWWCKANRAPDQIQVSTVDDSLRWLPEPYDDGASFYVRARAFCIPGNIEKEITGPVLLQHSDIVLVKTGVIPKLGRGWEVAVQSLHSFVLAGGMVVLSVPTISLDGNRGEIGVILHCVSTRGGGFTLNVGDCFAKIVFRRFDPVEIHHTTGAGGNND